MSIYKKQVIEDDEFLMEMMNTKGWEIFIRAVQDEITVLENTAYDNPNVEEWHFRRGYIHLLKKVRGMKLAASMQNEDDEYDFE